MGFPSNDELKRARKDLEKVEGTLLISDNATPLEKFRWDICQKFISYKRKKQITQKQLALELGVDEAKVSKILRHRIEKFSTDRLLNLLSIIEDGLSLKVM